MVCVVDVEVFSTGSAQDLFFTLSLSVKESKWRKSNSMFHKGVVTEGKQDGQTENLDRNKFL